MGIDVHKDHGKRECPACAVEVPRNNNRCPICGYEFPNPSASKLRFKIIGAILMLLLCLAIFVF